MTWDAARRLLAVRLDALGDVLMTTPALRALKSARPGRHLTLLTSPAGAAAAALVPEVDQVLVYEAPWMKATPPRADRAADLAMIDRLRAERFDAAAIFTVYSQNPLPAALLCHLADVPLRLAHCHENPYQLLTDWVLDPEPARGVRHEVRRQLDLVAAVGAGCDAERLSLTVPADARMRVAGLLRERGLDRRRWIVLHPGGTAPSRRYPPEQFAEAARALVRATGCAVVLSGAEGEHGTIDRLRALIGGDAVMLPALALADFAALVEAAPLLVSNNSGPVHVAAAVGTAVVDLYALTNPQHTPWGVPHRVLFHDVPCKYCYKSVCPEGHHDCLRRVPAKAVAEAALSLLPRGWVRAAA
ncbi:MAG TPA: glycosyltransferase family 9 protein [Methylomirabilota bacterium]